MKFIKLLWILPGLLLIAACSQQATDNDLTDWRGMQLKDIRTQNQFTVNEFDNPVILESFAVWCPLCTKQQVELQKLHELMEVVTISVNTDPNEDEQAVLQHIESNRFTGLYAVAPKEFTQSLIDEFGVGVVNAPSVPKILICPDGTTHFMKKGVTLVEQLQSEINTLCQNG